MEAVNVNTFEQDNTLEQKLRSWLDEPMDEPQILGLWFPFWYAIRGYDPGKEFVIFKCQRSLGNICHFLINQNDINLIELKIFI